MSAPLANRFTCMLLLALAVGIGGLESLARAGVSDHLHLPITGKRIRTARLELESRWVGGTGYRPVKVTIHNAPTGPTKWDRDFRVRLMPHNYYGSNFNVKVEAIVEMPEGTTSGTAWIAIPQTSQWQQMDVEVREGGQRINELSQNNMQLNGANGYYGVNAYIEAMPSVLFIDSDTPTGAARDSLVNRFRSTGSTSITNPTFDLPDLRMWQSIVPNANEVWNRGQGAMVQVAPGAARAPDVEVLALISQMEKIEVLHPSDLPEEWLQFTNLDLVVVPLDDLVKLAKHRPKCWEAIKRWAASGPSLVITDVGEDFKRLGEVEKLLGLPKDDSGIKEIEEHPGWTTARTDYALGRVRAVDSAVNVNQYGNVSPIVQNQLGVDPQSITVDAKKPPFAVRTYGLGRVAAVIKKDPLDNPPNEMAWLLNQLDARNWMSYQRNGVSFTRQNGDFMNFLIEGTGQVPVFSFLVLISGFVVVIGPINYVLLKRWRRLFLLLVTVPAGAAVITVSLFAYAIVSDGLGVRMRARSFTRLDQRTGLCSTWARQTYYAGLAPSGGLRFPTDAAVYPIDERPTGSGGNSARIRELVWNDEDQQLASGYINSRQTSQYLVISSNKSERKLEVKTAGPNAPPKVVNHLGAEIEHLILRDKEGEYFVADGLAADAETVLSMPKDPKQPVSTDAQKYLAALKPFSAAYNDRQSKPPLGYETDRYGGGLFGFTNSGYRYYYDQTYERGLPTPMFGSSILERELQRTSTNNTNQMAPGSYLAMLKTSAEMPKGYTKVKEQGSFHILEGRW